MYLLNLILSLLEKVTSGLPVVLKDSDLLLGDRLSRFESRGWRCLQLTDPDREFFVLLEAETLNQAGEKTLVSIGNRSERDLVFLAEYWDKGSCILVTAINLLTELKIDRKSDKKDVLVFLVKYGLDQSEEWWRELQQKGIESINRKLREEISGSCCAITDIFPLFPMRRKSISSSIMRTPLLTLGFQLFPLLKRRQR